MGQAIAVPLRDNDYTVNVLAGRSWLRSVPQGVSRNRRSSPRHRKVSSLLGGGSRKGTLTQLRGEELQLLVIALNWRGLRVMTRLESGIRDQGCPILVLSKGICPTTLADDEVQGAAELLAEFFKPSGEVYFFAGPCVARDLENRVQTTAVLVGDGPRMEGVACMLSTTYLKVFLSRDVKGAASAAALKNFYAVVLGIATGVLAPSVLPTQGVCPRNTSAYLFTQAAAEVEELVSWLGGTRSSARGVEGIGDLYVTCGGGRNHRAGVLIGQGESMRSVQLRSMRGATVEGLELASEMGPFLLAKADCGDLELPRFPLLDFGLKILVKGKDPKTAWWEFWSTTSYR